MMPWMQVTIAAQVYDFIDKHIKDLDNDLAALSQEIEADKNQLGLKGDETACGRLGVELKRGPKARVGKGAAAAAAADGEAPTKGRRKRKKEEDALQGKLAWASLCSFVSLASCINQANANAFPLMLLLCSTCTWRA
jgi:hypothetical protein